MASAALPMSRTAADKLLVELLGRVESVRDNPKWCFNVDRVILLGGYISTAITVGDIDIGLALRVESGACGTPVRHYVRAALFGPSKR